MPEDVTNDSADKIEEVRVHYAWLIKRELIAKGLLNPDQPFALAFTMGDLPTDEYVLMLPVEEYFSEKRVRAFLEETNAKNRSPARVVFAIRWEVAFTWKEEKERGEIIILKRFLEYQTERGLLRMPNFGNKSLAIIKGMLARDTLTLTKF